jgi:hypothetical protein
MPNRSREDKPDQIAGDRREDRRYPMALELKYKLIRRRRVLEVGKGATLDLSTGGILFEAEHALPVGLNVELLIDWPVLLHNVAPMRLMVTGKIVRNAGRQVAIQSVQHEFRTQGSAGVQNPAGRNLLERRPMNPMQFFDPSGTDFGNLQ